jgi:hypothetical protein
MHGCQTILRKVFGYDAIAMTVGMAINAMGRRRFRRTLPYGG